MSIFLPILIIAAVSLLFGLILNMASVIMAVPVNEKITAVTEALPGVNCGSCGYSSCSDYATALVNDDAAVNSCLPGGKEASDKISLILNKAPVKFTSKTAVVHCGADSSINSGKLTYNGIRTCSAASQFFGGPSNCEYGCIGFGDCVKSCDYGAIFVCAGIAVINSALCKACGKCVSTCPKNIISLQSTEKTTIVKCSNEDRGNLTKAKCIIGCIGCKICVKACKSDAITVNDNLASIDSEKCTNCGECIKVCPQNSIRNEKVCI